MRSKLAVIALAVAASSALLSASHAYAHGCQSCQGRCAAVPRPVAPICSLTTTSVRPVAERVPKCTWRRRPCPLTSGIHSSPINLHAPRDAVQAQDVLSPLLQRRPRVDSNARAVAVGRTKHESSERESVMKRSGSILLAAFALAAVPETGEAHGPFHTHHPDHWAARHAQGMSWHANYYHTATGAPVPLVVPPIAHMQTRWAWGVSQGTMTPIYHQFRRPYHGDGGLGAADLNGTPRWPSNTDQFGVYYIRAPY